MAENFEWVSVVLIIGCVVGWLFAKIVQVTGFGLFADIAISVVGAFIGGALVVPTGVAPVVSASIGGAIGAVLLLLVARFAAPFFR